MSTRHEMTDFPTGRGWDAARARVLYALNWLRLPRDEFEALVAEHGEEIAAWFGGAEEKDESVTDRLLHRSHVLNIKGRSYRLRDLEDALKLAHA